MNAFQLVLMVHTHLSLMQEVTTKKKNVFPVVSDMENIIILEIIIA